MADIITVKNLTKNYGKLTALDGVDLTVKDRECFALIGLNGAGKTTFINVVTTLLSYDKGEVLIDGIDLLKNPFEIKKIINVSPQESAVCKNLTVEENLALIVDLYQLQDGKQKIEQVIKEFQLEQKRKVLAKKLSGGQLKRLSIALAVITEPKILFLDEPTLGLDVMARRKLWEIIKEQKSKRTVFLTTHYLEEVENLTDRVAIISAGKIKATGSVQEILTLTGKSTLEEAFISLAEVE